MLYPQTLQNPQTVTKKYHTFKYRSIKTGSDLGKLLTTENTVTADMAA